MCEKSMRVGRCTYCIHCMVWARGRADQCGTRGTFKSHLFHFIFIDLRPINQPRQQLCNSSSAPLLSSSSLKQHAQPITSLLSYLINSGSLRWHLALLLVCLVLGNLVGELLVRVEVTSVHLIELVLLGIKVSEGEPEANTSEEGENSH